MSPIFMKQKGNIGIAIVVALTAVMSGVSFAAIAFRDSNSFRHQLDAVQQFHLLRAEVGRGRLMASHLEAMDQPPLQSVLPTRIVRVSFGGQRTVYRSRTKLTTDPGRFDTGFTIRSLITAARGSIDTGNPNLQSPVKRYGENRIRSLQTLAIFHYFSDIDRERDDVAGNIRFFGGDTVHGRVHSNTDIWIRQAQGWPTFYGLVSTAGEIKVYPGGGGDYPEEDIFKGGLIENYPRVVFEPTAELVRRYGQTPFGREERDDKIAYITVDGSRYEVMIGDIEKNGTKNLTIYDSYPPYGPIGDSIGVNNIPIRDTVWTRGPGGSLRDGSIFVPMELWISGTFGGGQTWASSHNIYLKDDLLYERTIPGQPPDGGPEGNDPINPSDYLGIISEESIIIQYGHVSPIDSLRQRPNIDDIYMYGAYCAVGRGEETWEDGIVTFQYQFPKGSTPNMTIEEQRFTNIDLHLFDYPTSTQRRWPPGLDYPWYNPLWPEPGPLYGVPGLPGATPNPHNAPTVAHLRGAIRLYGSIAQRRRGYVRRSGTSDFDTGHWDIDNDINPNTPPTFGAPPPNLISPVGYDKRYIFDNRFELTGPPHFPLVKFEGYETDELMDLGHLTVFWVFRTPPSNF